MVIIMHSNNIKFSVVIPVYNAEKFLSKCLEHLIHQTYDNLEIIIVDDGSTDNVAAVYNNYAKKDKRIIIKKQKNGGPSVASNTGLDMASGDYIHFHDHDDFLNLDYFEIMAQAAVLTDADILCGEVNQESYDFPVFDHLEICTSLEDKIFKTRANKFNPAWRYVYKKSFLKANKLYFEPAVFGQQDILFTKPAVIFAKTIALVPKARYNVVNTLTALGKDKKKISHFSDDTQAAWNRYHTILEKHNATELMKRPLDPYHTETFRVFNVPVIKKEIFGQKTRYYLFGVNVGTRHFQ